MRYRQSRWIRESIHIRKNRLLVMNGYDETYALSQVYTPVLSALQFYEAHGTISGKKY